MQAFLESNKKTFLLPIALLTLAVVLSVIIARGLVSSNLMLAGIVGLLCVFFITKNNLWVFVVVVLFPIRDLALFTIGPANIRIGDVAIVVAIMWLFFRKDIWPQVFQILKNPLTKTLIVFVLLVTISVFWSYSFSLGLTRAIKLLRALFIYIFLASTLIFNWKLYSKQLLLGVAIGMLALSLGWVYSAAMGGGLSSLQELDDFTSRDVPTEFRNTGRGILATFGAKTVALYVFMLLGFIPLIHKRWYKAVVILLFLMGIFVVIGSLFRSLILGVFIGLIIIIAWGVASNKRFSSTLIKSVLGALVITYLFMAISGLDQVVQGRFISALDSSDGSFTLRLEFSRQLLTWWSSNVPSVILGVGAESFIARTTLYVHSLYVQILGEQGLIGFLVFLTFIVLTFVELYKSYSIAIRLKDSKAIWLLMTLVGSYVSFLIISASGSDLSEFNYWILAAMIVAMHIRLRKVFMDKQQALSGLA